MYKDKVCGDSSSSAYSSVDSAAILKPQSTTFCISVIICFLTMYLPNESPISSRKWIVTSRTLNEIFWFRLMFTAASISKGRCGYITFLVSIKSVSVSNIFWIRSSWFISMALSTSGISFGYFFSTLMALPVCVRLLTVSTASLFKLGISLYK